MRFIKRLFWMFFLHEVNRMHDIGEVTDDTHKLFIRFINYKIYKIGKKAFKRM